MVSPNSIIVIEDSTLICLGTDPQSLAEVGMMGWQKGYELACHDAPQFLSFPDRQEIAEQASQDCFWQFAPLDTNTLKGAYHLGWHMGYTAAMRGDSWVRQSGQIASDQEESGTIIGLVSDDYSQIEP
jgi:hypothetical protein